MLFIYGDKVATIIQTLNEKLADNSSPYFLLSLKHIATGDTEEILLDRTQDKSAYPNRFNEFEIDAVVKPQGFYTYAVYEMSDAENKRQDKPIEVGRALLTYTRSKEVTEYKSETSQITEVYNG